MAEKRVDVADLIKYVMAARCALPLAVERINRDFGVGYTKEQLLSEISSNTGDLAEQVRTLMILQTMDLHNQLQLALITNLSEMSPGEIARLFSANSNSLTNLTARPIVMEDSEPISYLEAKNKLVNRLNNYAERKSANNIDSDEESDATKVS